MDLNEDWTISFLIKITIGGPIIQFTYDVDQAEQTKSFLEVTDQLQISLELHFSSHPTNDFETVLEFLSDPLTEKEYYSIMVNSIVRSKSFYF